MPGYVTNQIRAILGMGSPHNVSRFRPLNDKSQQSFQDSVGIEQIRQELAKTQKIGLQLTFPLLGLEQNITVGQVDFPRTFG